MGARNLLLPDNHSNFADGALLGPGRPAMQTLENGT